MKISINRDGEGYFICIEGRCFMYKANSDLAKYVRWALEDIRERQRN
jgi:hypothetical protein